MKLQINSTLIQNVMWARIWRLLIVVTAVCALVPWLPVMPQAGLDHSWVLGMNQAVAQGLVFGRDMIFTFGPYASGLHKIVPSGHRPSDGRRGIVSGPDLRRRTRLADP
ncbi:hypothetical protein [Ralstonia pseudosolanacearum]|uniref:hypothetical protein n=1 Tax=Ralstonia pseudosolanacearum TaxID=1310165 RepID=UPI0020C760F3|nr:hypothetical protein [Ralstonia pseudosolanacearum]